MLVDSEINLELEQFGAVAPDARSHQGCAACGQGEPGEASQRPGDEGERPQLTTGVRFGYMRFIGDFSYPPEMKFAYGAKLVIQTQRGIEIGEQVPLTCSGCDKAVDPDQVKRWVEQSGEDTYILSAGRILREATAADLAEYAHIQSSCREKRDFAQSIANRHSLPLRVSECECTFGGERVIFYFTAAERVDFRAMVKDLAKEYRTRIEMRQIGARDEARLLADYETCGCEVCCKTFLKTLKPISMRMAKLQKATLDPSQVSGRCGRLKCCLKYEHTGYEELDKNLPRNGVRIRTEHGEGVVASRQILTQLVQIRTDAGALLTVAVEDINETNVPTPEPVENETVERQGSATTPAPTTRSPSRRGRSAEAPVQTPRRPKRRSVGSARPQSPSGPSPQPGQAGGPGGPAPEAPPSDLDGNRAEKEGPDVQASRRRRGRRVRRRRRPRGADGSTGSSTPGSGP